MADITIEKKSESSQSWEFEVTVVVDWEKTAHRVTLDRTYLEGLVGERVDPEAFVRASFMFLLERERPREILPRFNVHDITRYFSEYEAAMKRQASLL
jgi:hypothetical protein